jgi:hypothetical protein
MNRRGMKKVDQLGLGFGAVLVASALFTAAASRAPAPEKAMTAELSVDAFRFLANAEQAGREKSIDGFLNDPWSQDDDFHSGERGRVDEFAAAHRLRRQDVLRAFEEGLRAGWPLPEGVRLKATVPRCRPRPL